MTTKFKPSTDHLDPATPCECGNCNWQGPLSELDEIEVEHFEASVSPGEPCPAGECPECNCFAHIIDAPGKE